MNLEKFIGRLISTRQNDLQIMKQYVEENGIKDWNFEEIDGAFDVLLMGCTRVLVNHQYCTNPSCACSAKNRLRAIAKLYDEIYKNELYEDEYIFLQSLVEELD